MKRWEDITAQDVIDAYARHPEVAPEQGTLAALDPDELEIVKACALGILVIDSGFQFKRHGPESDAWGAVAEYAFARLPRTFIAGIERGFDGGDREFVDTRHLNPDQYEHGYTVGSLARKEFIARGGTEVR